MRFYRLCAVVSFAVLLIVSAGCIVFASAAAPSLSSGSAGKADAKVQEVKSPGSAPGDLKSSSATKPDAKKGDGPSSGGGQQVLPAAPVIHSNAIGCILPLSGRFADTGGKALDAVLLSADIFNQRHAAPWKIVVADSGGSDESIKDAVAYLADKANVMAMIAVAGSSEAISAAVEAEKRKTPLILITSREGVTEGRRYVFQHFLTPSQQMKALADYALDGLNVAIFSVLYPQDDYGNDMLRLFRREVQKKGGKINKEISYPKTQTDFSEQIGKLIGQKAEAPKKLSAPPQEAKSGVFIDFEALFIPDSPLRVKMITSQLAFYDVKGVQLLGTSQWHSSDLLKKNAEYLEGAVFADSFLPNGFLPETNDFVEIYYSAYSREPENVDALSFDTMEMVLGILEEKKIKTRDDFMASLLEVNRFRGATGSVYFSGKHVAQKNAFMVKIENGQLQQVR